MPAAKSYPRARARQGAVSRTIRQQGRVARWVAETAGMSTTRLHQIAGGLEVPLQAARDVAGVLEVEVESLFEVIEAPDAREAA